MRQCSQSSVQKDVNAIGIPMPADHDQGETGKDTDTGNWSAWKMDANHAVKNEMNSTRERSYSTSRHAQCRQENKKSEGNYVFTHPFPHLSTVDGFITINYKRKVLGIIMYTFLPSIIYKRLVA